jgi:hypothetical protein
MAIRRKVGGAKREMSIRVPGQVARGLFVWPRALWKDEL